jgi:hypothetical protein
VPIRNTLCTIINGAEDVFLIEKKCVKNPLHQRTGAEEKLKNILRPTFVLRKKYAPAPAYWCRGKTCEKYSKSKLWT